MEAIAVLQAYGMTIVAAIVVALYARHRFSQPTASILEQTEIEPPKKTRFLTTLVRYHLGATLYMCVWLLVLLCLVSIPGLMKLILWTIGAFGVPQPDWLAEVPQMLAEGGGAIALPFLSMVLIIAFSRIPPVSGVERHLREKFDVLAKIPFKAILMSQTLAKRAVEYPRDFVHKMEEEAYVRRLKACHRSIYDDWMKLCHFVEQIEGWGGDEDFSRYLTINGKEWQRLSRVQQDLAEKLRRLSCGLEPEEEIPRKLANYFEGEAKSRSNELEHLLKQVYVFVSYAVLFSFATERARNDGLSRLGIRQHDRGESFPLDASALTLTWMLVFLIIVGWTFVFYCIPGALGGDPFTASRAVTFGVIGSWLHFGAVVVAVQLRRWLAQTGIGNYLEATDTYTRPYGMYFVQGTCGMLVGAVVCVLGKLLLLSQAPALNDLYWGLGAFVTAASVGLHQDRARSLVAAHARTAAATPPRHWREPVVQGLLTLILTLFSWLMAAGNGSIGDWKWLLFVAVAGGSFGAFLGSHLPENFRRRELGAPAAAVPSTA